LAKGRPNNKTTASRQIMIIMDPGRPCGWNPR
jgi:hypothetical protein